MHPDVRPDARRRPFLAALALLVLSLAAFAPTPAHAALAAPAAPAAGSIGIRLVDSPSDRADDPRARQYVIDHLQPGATIERRVEVSNTTATPQDVQLYAAAAGVRKGEFTFGVGRAANDLSAWTSVSPSSLQIPAGGKKLATVRVSVPKGTTDGERYAVVWAQPPAAKAPDGGIRTVNRVGIRMYLSVGEGKEPASDFEVSAITASRTKGGAPRVTATVRNTGGRALDLEGTLSLADGPGGSSAGPYPADAGTTLGIDDTEPVTIDLDKDLPNGPWLATVTLRSGTTIREAKARITFPAAGHAAPAVRPEATGGGSSWLVPVVALAVVLLLVVAGAFAIARRRRGDEPSSSGATPTAAA